VVDDEATGCTAETVNLIKGSLRFISGDSRTEAYTIPYAD
jgi:hypothetical protein